MTRHLSSAYPDQNAMPDYLPAVAAAIADVWANDLARRPLPADMLPLLASRALWRIGEQDAARGLLNTESALGRLLETGGPSLSACGHLASRVMRPVDSAMAVTGPAWALNVERLGAVSMELGLFQRVRTVLEQVAEVWDADSGKGVLLIRCDSGVPGLSVYVQSVVERIGLRRGWRSTPDIVRAELG